MALIDDVLVYYELDEVTGTNANDEVGSNNGTANNARVFTTEEAGIINTGADFSGGDDYITGFNVYTILGANDFSISVWAYIDTGAALADIVHNWDANKGFTIRSSGNDLITYIYPNNKRITTSNAFPTSGWYHIVLTLDSSNLQKQYVNGVKVGELASNAMGNPSIVLAIGSSSALDANFFGNTIDEVSFFGVDIGLSGAQELYNSGSGLAYPFDAPSGVTRKIKIAGTFQDKPIKTKVAGTFVDKPIKIKVGGTFQDA